MAASLIAPPDGFELEGQPPPPDGFEIESRAPVDMAAGNKAFSRTFGNAIGAVAKPAGQTLTDVASLYAPLEAAANAGTGLLFGFPAYIGAGLSGITQKYLLGMDVDPKEMAETISKIATYQPVTERGRRLTGNLMLPLTMLQEAATGAGEKVSDIATGLGASTNIAAGAGAVTDATIQMLGPILTGEMVRKLGGQAVTAEDMKNVATTVAGEGAADATVANVERSLRGIYDKTGIGPFTIAKEAAADARLASELKDPAVEIPSAIEPFVEGYKAPEVPEATPVADTMEGASKELVDASERPAVGPSTLTSGIDPTVILNEIKGTASDIADAAKAVTNGIVDSAPGQELIKATFPMSAGAPEAQAVAQKFANAMRVARFQWQRVSEYIGEKFTPDERKAMYEAAEEQNLLLTRGEETAGKGIDRLTPDQRGVVNELHQLSEQLWKRAQDAGMVEGEGLKFWTPRMAVMIGEDGSLKRPPGGAGPAAREGGNVKTTASSLKQRKYETAAETEAAMKGALGDEASLVRDIGVMPLAMQRMSEAIAGRELVNQIKELGLATGEDIISTDAGKPGFATIDHPAFTTYRPEFVKGADGNVTARMDTAGNPVMERVPLRIAKEWEGPIKAVLSSNDGALYKLSMLIKSKAMTAIMISPMAHNMVIFGRALAYDPVAVASLRAYFAGHALAKDGQLMSQAINDGMVPIGANRGSMLDITDVARSIGKEGSWGDMNESWINLAARKVGNILHAGTGEWMKSRMDAFGDWWHHTLLWKQVGALQMYVWNDYKQYLLDRGHPPEVAGPIAAHLANRYAGAVASENSSAMVRKALNVMLFSRSFNVGNVGAVHDAFMGMPAGLRAKMFADVGPEAAQKGLDAATAKARMGLATDLGMSMLMTAAASAAVAKLLQNQTVDDIASGYTRRLQAMFGNIQEHPLQPDSYNPYRILPTFENEPGKEERIDLGAQNGGRHEYLRLPTGKVVEDTVGWLMHPYDTVTKKLSPLVKGVKEAILNDKGFGVPVEDPEGGWLKHLAQGLEHVIQSQVPMDQLKTLWDVMNGVGTDIDKQKLLGAASGFSFSQGNPHGPEGAVYQAQKDRVEAARAYAMEAVRDDIKHGREEEAAKRLADIGIPPREIVLTINAIKNPRQGMSKVQTRRFVQQASDEDLLAIRNARRQAETE